MGKAMKVTTTTSFTDAKGHALTLTAEGHHVSIHTWGHGEAPGNHTDVVLYALTVDELLQLGQSIMLEVGRLIAKQEGKCKLQ